MTLQSRDRRALALLGVALILGLAYRFWPENPGVTVVGAVADPVNLAEKKLAKLRESAATVEAKEAALKKLSAELAEREKSIVSVETVPQAQAQMLQIFRRVATTENPPVDIRGSELSTARALGDAYGEVNIAVQIECKIEQLVNILSAISQQPELISLTELRITSSNPKEKTVGARLALSAVVPKKVIPEKGKGGNGF